MHRHSLTQTRVGATKDRVPLRWHGRRRGTVRLHHLSTYLLLYNLPLLTQAIRKNFPHLLAHFDVSLRELFELDTLPVLRVTSLSHESFVTLAARIGSLDPEVLMRYGGPIHAFGTSFHQLAIGSRSPCRVVRAGGMSSRVRAGHDSVLTGGGAAIG